MERVRVAGHGMSLRGVLEAIEAEIGDTVTIRFEGEQEIQTGKMAGKTFRKFSGDVRRGHH